MKKFLLFSFILAASSNFLDAAAPKKLKVDATGDVSTGVAPSAPDYAKLDALFKRHGKNILFRTASVDPELQSALENPACVWYFVTIKGAWLFDGDAEGRDCIKEHNWTILHELACNGTDEQFEAFLNGAGSNSIFRDRRLKVRNLDLSFSFQHVTMQTLITVSVDDRTPLMYAVSSLKKVNALLNAVTDPKTKRDLILKQDSRGRAASMLTNNAAVLACIQDHLNRAQEEILMAAEDVKDESARK